MDTVHGRLSYYIEKQGFTLREFCKKFDFQYNSFTQIAAGTRPLGRNILDKIVSALPNLSVDWLLYGRGKPEVSNVYVSEEVTKKFNEPGYNSDLFEELLLKYLKKPSIQDTIRDITNQK